MQRKEVSFSGQKIFIGIDVHKDSWRVAIAMSLIEQNYFIEKGFRYKRTYN